LKNRKSSFQRKEEFYRTATRTPGPPKKNENNSALNEENTPFEEEDPKLPKAYFFALQTPNLTHLSLAYSLIGESQEAIDEVFLLLPSIEITFSPLISLSLLF